MIINTRNQTFGTNYTTSHDIDPMPKLQAKLPEPIAHKLLNKDGANKIRSEDIKMKIQR